MGGDDLVNVRLSKFGQEYASGAPLYVHEGHHEFSFTAGQSQRVTRAFDWERVLKNVLVGGLAVFEVAPEVDGSITGGTTEHGGGE